MKDCVLRIYHRGKNDPRTFVGEVEEVGVERNKAFSNVNELWAILDLSKAETKRSKKSHEFLKG